MLQIVSHVLSKGSNLKWNESTMRDTEQDKKSLDGTREKTGTKLLAQSHLAKVCIHSLGRLKRNSDLIIII